MGELQAEAYSIQYGWDKVSIVRPANVYGDYDNFGVFIKMGVIGIASSFIVLIAFYIFKEIYSYILILATNLISFLPKFAIPLAIRNRSEN